jgi:hypothetical protein
VLIQFMKQVLCILLLSLFAVSCKKKVTDNQSTYEYTHGKISSSLYPYLFNVGSYWVYKDTANSNLDSVTLTDIQRDTFIIGPSVPGQGPRGELEYFDTKYYSSYQASSYSEKLMTYVISRSLDHAAYIFLSGKGKGYSLENAKIVDVIDSIIIENAIYRNVTKMKITKSYYINGNFYFYYADSIGVVKRETITNDTVIQTWNLLRHNVTMYKY